MADGNFLTDSDVSVLKEVVRLVKSGRINTPSRPSTDENALREQDYMTPEIYIAKPQTEIPAGSISEAGKATCDIYRILISGGTPNIVQIDNYAKPVYNIGGEVSTDDLILVAKTSFGHWVAVPSGSSNCDFIRFKIISANTTSATVDILARPKGCDSVLEEPDLGTSTAETLVVHDKAGCFLNEPAEDLVDRIGFAKFLVSEEDEGKVGTGTSNNAGDWEIVQLCCPTCEASSTGTGI